MEAWMLLMLLVVAVLGVAVGLSLYLKERQMDRINEEFLAEAEMRFGYGKIEPKEEIEVYDTLKKKVHQTYKTQCNLPENPEEDDSVRPEDSWLRQLPQEAHMMLCKAFMHRAICNIPRFRHLQKDLQPKYMLYRKQLITERQWNGVVAAQERLAAELNFIRVEAHRLRDQWKDDGIVQQAVYMHNQMEEAKKRKEKEEEPKKVVPQETSKRKKSQEETPKEQVKPKAKPVQEKKTKEDVDKKLKMAQQAAEDLLRDEENKKAK